MSEKVKKSTSSRKKGSKRLKKVEKGQSDNNSGIRVSSEDWLSLHAESNQLGDLKGIDRVMLKWERDLMRIVR